MERTSVLTDIKGVYLQSELDSVSPQDSCGANPTSAPTVVGVTDPGSYTGTTTTESTEADRVCSAKDTQEMAGGLQTAGTHITGAHAILITHSTHSIVNHRRRTSMASDTMLVMLAHLSN